MTGASLLSLPREVRDQIIDLCLTTELPPPPLGEIYTLQPVSFSEYLTSSTQKKNLRDVNFPAAPRTNSGGLLLASRQISAETRDALKRLNSHGKLDYVMRLRIEEEEGDSVGNRERYSVDWAVLPTKSWLTKSRAVKTTTTKQTQTVAAENAQPPVNLVIEVEKTMRAKAAGPSESEPQSESQEDVAGQHIFEPPATLTALYLRYHFLCRPEHRSSSPPPAPRSLLVAADHGVLLLHWTLGDLIARIVHEGPCFATSITPRPPSPSSSSSSSSSPQQQDHDQQPPPFNLTLRDCQSSPPPPPSPSSPTTTTTTPQTTVSTTQPLDAPLREFLPFYLHSAKLTHTPFGALLSRRLLRGFALETRQRCPSPPTFSTSSGPSSASAAAAAATADSGIVFHGDHHRRQTRTWRLPQGQAACPVPERSEGGRRCCGDQEATGDDGAVDAADAADAAAGLHWVCDVVREVREAEEDAGRRGGGVERDYDDDW